MCIPEITARCSVPVMRSASHCTGLSPEPSPQGERDHAAAELAAQPRTEPLAQRVNGRGPIRTAPPHLDDAGAGGQAGRAPPSGPGRRPRGVAARAQLWSGAPAAPSTAPERSAGRRARTPASADRHRPGSAAPGASPSPSAELIRHLCGEPVDPAGDDGLARRCVQMVTVLECGSGRLPDVQRPGQARQKRDPPAPAQRVRAAPRAMPARAAARAIPAPPAAGISTHRCAPRAPAHRAMQAARSSGLTPGPVLSSAACGRPIPDAAAARPHQAHAAEQQPGRVVPPPGAALDPPFRQPHGPVAPEPAQRPPGHGRRLLFRHAADAASDCSGCGAGGAGSRQSAADGRSWSGTPIRSPSCRSSTSTPCWAGGC